MAKLIQLLCLMAVLTVVSAQQPIPKRYDGYPMGDTDAPLLLEAFYDFMCPDSRASWTNLKTVLQSYGSSKIRFYLHRFPLPYHHNSFLANQGGDVAQSLGASPIQWMEAVYANQEAFGNSATANMSMNQVISQFGDLAQKSLSVSKDNFVAGLNNRTLDLELRTAWKYACSRGITGTPIFLLNGVTAPAESTWSVQQWKTLLNQYL